MTSAKKADETVDLPLLEAGGPDERLLIICGCNHRSAYHDNLGCKYVAPAKAESAGYAGQRERVTPEIACTCPTPREVVYLGGRLPVVNMEVAK